MFQCSFSEYLTLLLYFGQSNTSKGSTSLPEPSILYRTVLRLSRINLNLKKQPGASFFFLYLPYKDRNNSKKNWGCLAH